VDKRYIVGTLVPKLRTVRMVARYAELVDFVKRQTAREFTHRGELYRFVCERLGPQPIDLVELGVWRGESIRLWLAAQVHPDSRFFGLDTFEGLPEPWEHLIGRSPKGTFSVDGQVPIVADSRVAFRKGLIQNLLKPLLLEMDVSDKPLVVHFDADLYSTTLYALTTLDVLLASTVDSYVAVFDEFSSANDEYRAFEDYRASYLRDFRVLGHVGKCYDQVAMEISFRGGACGATVTR
jgi:hypothetical protein